VEGSTPCLKKVSWKIEVSIKRRVGNSLDHKTVAI